MILSVIGKLKGKMKMLPPTIYKVWLPGQTPDTHTHTLTLENAQAIQFFVESIACGARIFAEQPIAICAYHVANQLMEQEIAHGTYRLHRDMFQVHLLVIHDSGNSDGNPGLITEALQQAIEERLV